MIKVLFVCLGNICRSPLAEGIFQSQVFKRGLKKYIACDSAGTSGWHIGENPDKRSIQIARENDIVLNHHGRQIHPIDFDNFDYIVAMDEDNYRDIISLRNNHHHGKAEVVKMLGFDNNSSGGNIPDPYYGGQDGFQEVFDMLNESVSNLIDYIVSVHRLDNEQ